MAPVQSPQGISWGIATSDGVRMMLLGPNFAELYDRGLAAKLAQIEF
jgi:hypothetical protein